MSGELLKVKLLCVCVLFPEECKDCHEHKEAGLHPAEPLRERPVEEVAARLAQQEKEEQDIVACRITISPPSYMLSL